MPKAWWLLALPFVAGAFLPLQAGINGQLAKQVSSVMSAALVSFLVGTLALLAVVLIQRELPTFEALKGVSWWQWSGGLLGAVFIATAAFVSPRIGALLFMTLVLAGQLSMALMLDHFGWAGYREAPISIGKLAGLALIIGGVREWRGRPRSYFDLALRASRRARSTSGSCSKPMSPAGSSLIASLTRLSSSARARWSRART